MVIFNDCHDIHTWTKVDTNDQWNSRDDSGSELQSPSDIAKLIQYQIC